VDHPTALRKRLAEGGRAYGTMAFELFGPGLAPILVEAGCEFLILDMEHSGVGRETIKAQIRYARGLDLAVWVRVPELRYSVIAGVLDAGAHGIMVPMVETPEQAAELVRAARYRPEGERGCGFGLAHDDYRSGDPNAATRTANARTTLIALIETRRGLENVEAIMAVPGLDVGWLGHFDLTNSLGITAQFGHPDFLAACERIAKACEAAGKTAGMLDLDLGFLRDQVARGYRLLGYGYDTVVLREAYRQGLDALRALP
jgi:2-dehydro-3-deoxyglucarate aldolase/4-hydroxy-2-oxoheptanedioate aldolase